MKLEITADKVKEAAAKCPQAEATLKTLFPEVFDGDINLYKGIGIGDRGLFKIDGDADDSMISVYRGDHRYFYLSVHYDWELIKRDGYRHQLLKPTKK